MTKIRNHVMFETAKDVVQAFGERKAGDGKEYSLTVPSPELYLVFENDMQNCYISGFPANYSGDIFDISDDVTPEDIIQEMAKELKFKIHIT